MPAPGVSPRGATGAALRVALAAFAVMAAWAVAAPPYSGPDEPDHVLRAVSLARGQVVPHPFPPGGASETTVIVPQVFTVGNAMEECYESASDVPASCVKHQVTSSAPTAWTTYTGRYPPLYYAIVGLPSLAVVSPSAVYLMRLASALVSAALLGLAAYAVRRWSASATLPLGLLVAVTPMTLYLGGVVNPNGLEITAAIALWVSSLVLFGEYRSAPPRGLVAAVGVAAVVLALTRQLSPLWAWLILAATLALGANRHSVAVLRRRWDVWAVAALLVAATVASVAWTVRYDALALQSAGPVAPGASRLDIVWQAAQMIPIWIAQMVGIFGWLDAPAPRWALDLWYAVAGAVVVAGALLLSWRRRAVLLAVTVAGLGLSVLLDAAEARRVGLVWQGRYLLPFAVGLPLLASAATVGSRALRRHGRAAAVGVAVLLTAAQAGCFYNVLRRYTVGLAGPLTLSGGWQPPGGAWLVLAFALLASAAFAASVLALSWRRLGPPQHAASVASSR